MPMNKNVLATAIVNALKAAHGSAFSGAAEAAAIADWTIIAEQIILHIIGNAVITITDLPGTVTPTGQATRSSGANGTVTS